VTEEFSVGRGKEPQSAGCAGFSGGGAARKVLLTNAPDADAAALSCAPSLGVRHGI